MSQSLAQWETPTHLSCCYYSFEQQKDLQFRGLQFWRYYLQKISHAPNFFYHFNTANLFDYGCCQQQLPRHFFDLVIISHCFFYEAHFKHQSQAIYQSIFQNCLNPQGKVLLIIQINKFYGLFNERPQENLDKEIHLMKRFLETLGLRLIFYYYLTSTGKRTQGTVNFAEFARENLPLQLKLNPLHRQYFNLSFIKTYAADDFVIYAEPL